MTGDTANAAPQQQDAAPAVLAGEARRSRLVINLLLVAAFIVILNETIMGVAIPPLMRVFHVSASAAQWLTTAFLLTTAVVIPVTGFRLQRLNTRPVFICAMSLFSTGTLIAALAPTLGVLIFARVVQALGTAIMMPLLMTTVMTLVPPEARGRTMGNISIVISMAPAAGIDGLCHPADADPRKALNICAALCLSRGGVGGSGMYPPFAPTAGPTAGDVSMTHGPDEATLYVTNYSDSPAKGEAS